MVDDQFGGLQGIDFFGVAAEGLHGVAHGGEVDDGGDAGEVLHEDAGGHVGDFEAGLGGGLPCGEMADLGGGDVDAIFAAEQVFKQDLEAEGQAGEVEAGGGEGGQAVIGVFAAAGGQFGPALEGVHDEYAFLAEGSVSRWIALLLPGRMNSRSGLAAVD